MNGNRWIKIRFARGPARRMITGKKTLTSRRTSKGIAGDRFCKWGHTYEIVLVSIAPVEYIAKNLYTAEGYDTPEAYLKDIVKYYPDIEFKEKLFLHFFKEIQYDQKTLEMI